MARSSSVFAGAAVTRKSKRRRKRMGLEVVLFRFLIGTDPELESYTAKRPRIEIAKS